MSELDTAALPIVLKAKPNGNWNTEALPTSNVVGDDAPTRQLPPNSNSFSYFESPVCPLSPLPTLPTVEGLNTESLCPLSLLPPIPTVDSSNTEGPFTLDDDWDLHVTFDQSDEDENHAPLDQFQDPEGCNESDDDEAEETLFTLRQKGVFYFPPSSEDAQAAINEIQQALKPCRGKSRGYKDPALSDALIKRLDGIRMCLGAYVRLESKKEGGRGNWTKASQQTAEMRCEKPYYAKKVREWARAFIEDDGEVPIGKHSGGTRSAIDDDDFAVEINLHLQQVGKYVKAEDIVHYCGDPEVLIRLKRTKTIHIATARRWMEKMGYRWKKNHKGQYVDGHERKDVVDYRQNVFLPIMKVYEDRLRQWSEDHGWDLPPTVHRAIVIWYHDESTFYAHDRRQSGWYHKNATPTPYKKGEGLSLMVADFVSADYGWLRSPDGQESARVIFRAGARREGYFTTEDILDQARKAITILATHFTNEDHVFVYDNATTHLKRADEALSASQMPRGPSRSPETNFGVWVHHTGPDGRAQRDQDGKLIRKKIRMRNGRFADGREQDFYFPEGHECAGIFKGMANILTERGYDVSRKKAQCGKSFSHCPEGATDCCCRRMLYSEPDFVAEEPLLQTLCKEHNIPVHFLPKFHCELNFIEQCWGYAKRTYRLLPESSKDDDLERNVIASLDEVPLISMRRFAIRSLRFMDAYRKGLTGLQAAWAAKKYKGHRTVSEHIFLELEKAGIGN